MDKALQRTLPKKINHFKGSAFARWILLRFGWRILFDGVPGPRGVIAVYPHTSNWDFLLGILTKWAIGIPAHFWGKDSLFKLPLLGRWMRWVGGIPINRTSKMGVVTDTVAAMHAADFFWFGVAPEGTRKRIAGWRSGFYRVAVEGGVPLGITCFDYATKTVDLTHFFIPTGDEAIDMAHIATVLQGRMGYRPENMSPICLLDKNVTRDQSLVNTKALL